jgi:hypothetical protein
LALVGKAPAYALLQFFTFSQKSTITISYPKQEQEEMKGNTPIYLAMNN